MASSGLLSKILQKDETRRQDDDDVYIPREEVQLIDEETKKRRMRSRKRKQLLEPTDEEKEREKKYHDTVRTEFDKQIENLNNLKKSVIDSLEAREEELKEKELKMKKSKIDKNDPTLFSPFDSEEIKLRNKKKNVSLQLDILRRLYQHRDTSTATDKPIHYVVVLSLVDDELSPWDIPVDEKKKPRLLVQNPTLKIPLVSKKALPSGVTDTYDVKQYLSRKSHGVDWDYRIDDSKLVIKHGNKKKIPLDFGQKKVIIDDDDEKKEIITVDWSLCSSEKLTSYIEGKRYGREENIRIDDGGDWDSARFLTSDLECYNIYFFSLDHSDE